MSDHLNKEQAKQIVSSFLTKIQTRYKQEAEGENEEVLDRAIRKHRDCLARYSWKAQQKWCKWNDEGPVLMPDYTRIYYRKGATEILLQEFPPQVRFMKFRGALARRNSSTAELAPTEHDKVYRYSLALPYVVFLFQFVDGLFTEVRVAFSDRPLKRLEEKPLRPYLSNIDSNLRVCLGASFDRTELEKGNVTQQSALVLSHFWQTTYTDEWSSHYWNSKTHFQACDERLATLEAWQDASVENPLFVVEDANWLPLSDDNFGDMIHQMIRSDNTNHQLQEDLYKELVKDFLDDVKKTFGESLSAVGSKVSDKLVDQLADELVALADEQLQGS